MKHLVNQKGVALVMALILSVTVLAFSAALIYLVTQGTWMSGAFKRYHTAREAALGGVDLFNEIILGRVDPTTPACLAEKLEDYTSGWGSCSASQKTFDPQISPDYTKVLGDYKVYAKIVDTVPGYSEPNTTLGGHGAAWDRGITRSIGSPFVYRVNIFAERIDNPDERAEFTVLYAF